MRRIAFSIVALALASAVVLAQQRTPPSTLDIYFIDTEGGQATLFVTPAGQTLSQ